MALASMSSFLGGTGLVVGAQIRARRELSPLFCASLALEAFHGASAAGEADALGASVAAAVGIVGELVGLDIRVESGLRAGMAWLSGRSTTTQAAASVSGPWWGPMAQGSIGLRPMDALVIEAGVELGYSPLTITGLIDGQRVLRVGGPWLGGTIGLGFSFR
jgi:hypothetical protein